MFYSFFLSFLNNFLSGGFIMFFHFVKKGDSLYQLAKFYHVPLYRLIKDNGLEEPDHLSVGQCLIIRPKSFVYTVQKGDSLAKISADYHISIQDIQTYNADLTENLQIGQKIRLVYMDSKRKNISVNGYCYEGMDEEKLKQCLPSLSYLSIFAYRIEENGHLSSMKEEKLIKLARNYGVAPLMVVANVKEKGGFSSELASSVLSDSSKKNNLFLDILKTLQQKQYYGVNFDFEYVFEKEKEAYSAFLNDAYQFFSSRGYLFTIALAPKISSAQKGLLYTAHDYSNAGKNSDYVMLMTYEWGYTYGDAMPVAPYSKVKEVVEYALQEIPKQNILLGVPNYGYDFLYPKEKGVPAKSLSFTKAIELAYQKKAEIMRDNKNMTPYFTYNQDGKKHIVHFDDSYSFYKRLELVDDNSLGGISIWTIKNDTPQYRVLLNYFFLVDKPLEH